MNVSPMKFLETSLDKVITKRAAKVLATLGPTTVSELLRYFPRRYQAPGTLMDVDELVVGEHVTVMAEVTSSTIRGMRSRVGFILEARVSGNSGAELSLTFFSKNRGALIFHEKQLIPGRRGLFTGTVASYQGRPQLMHPDYRIIDAGGENEAELLAASKRPTPVYSASAKVSSWTIQAAIEVILGTLREDDVPDPIPSYVQEDRRLLSRFQALKQIHKPETEPQYFAAQKRLRFEEAFVLQAELARRRQDLLSKVAVARPLPAVDSTESILARFDARVPFTLTDGQRYVGEEIAQDLNQTHPMLRLLQGDVGSGKTIVALRAMLQVIDAGGQAALLAPTEVLAVQHARGINALLGDLADSGYLGAPTQATKVTLLTGSLGAKDRKQALLDAASGAAGIVVGTHALLSQGVLFADLGLLVVDEQHRFGVEQRDVLRTRFEPQPHTLVMTATPIPRTVAMTVFGDLTVSTLSELPAGRAPTVTYIVPAENPVWMNRVWERVREEVEQGRQAFVVCSRIHDDVSEPDASASDTAASDDPAALAERRQLRAVDEVLAELRSHSILHGLRIEMLHGQMPPAEKDAVMQRFAAAEIDVLVATTVIEVGIDVPRASTMVVLDADRFGISQLHQLRGRVGRGSTPGICLLVSSAPEDSTAAARLDALAATTDGFELARTDLELRSEGDVLGQAQSGRASSLALLRVLKDADVIEDAREAAFDVVGKDPVLAGYPALRDAIERQFGGREEYIDRA